MAGRICQRCGTELSSDAPQGLCPRCLVQAGIELAADETFVADSDSMAQTGAPESRIESRLRVGEGEQVAEQHIGRYRVVRPLGTGGMGEVYLAEDTRLERLVALKLLPATLAQETKSRQQFLIEAKAAAALNHPNICTIYEVDQTADERLFIAMEVVEGETLAARLRRGRLNAAEVVQIGMQVAEALAAAHAKGIVHRDIKPSNISLTERGGVKVLDFGLAKRLVLGETGDEGTTRFQTPAGEMLGTPHYVSPEQALGKEVDHRTDLFSLGIVLYQMVTDRLPFSGGTFTETVDRVLHGLPEALARFHYGVPMELERVILRCLEKEPGRRYQSAGEVVNALREVGAVLQPGGQAGLAAEVLTLVYMDLPVAAESRQGDKPHAAAERVQELGEQIGRLLEQFSQARKLESAGEKWLLSFGKPSAAVQFGLLLQAEAGEGPKPRLGIHLGEVVPGDEGDVKERFGEHLEICARLLQLAKPGQVLMSRAVFDSARAVLKGEEMAGVGALSWVSHGPYVLSGIEEPQEICEAGRSERKVFEPPSTSEGAQRYVSGEAEPVLGWRPGVAQEVVGTQWKLERKLGEGGFGEVWLARHATLKEQRVFKFCFRADRVRSLKREVTLFRLMRERLGEHPRITRLLNVNLDQPPFYLEEEYVAGQDLRTWCEEQGGVVQVPLAVRLEIVAQVAEGLQAAHDAGVIHRDIKPGNILVGGQELGISDQSKPSTISHQSPITDADSPLSVKLTDFGIGQVVSMEALAGMTKLGFTQTVVLPSSSHAGTQMYLAPELLMGKPATTRSDIYSLGVVLYQLLVGDFSRPLTADWAKGVADRLLREDLERCFAWNPEERYVGAIHLANNLRALPQRRKAREREAKARETARHWRMLLAASSVVAAVLMLLALVLGYGLRRAQRERDHARVLLYTSDMSLGFRALEENHLGKVRDLLARHLPKKGDPDLRGWEWRYLWQESRGDQEFTFGTFSNYVYEVAFSPNGRLLAAGDYNGVIMVWDVRSQELVAKLDTEKGIPTALRFSRDSRQLTAGFTRFTATNLFEIWDTATWQRIPAPDLVHPVEYIVVASSLSPDATRLATATRGSLILWDLRDGHPILKQPMSFYEPFTACSSFSLDGRTFAYHSSGRIHVWDLVSHKRVASVAAQSDRCLYVALAPDGRLLAGGYQDVGTIQVWSLPEARLVAKLDSPQRGVCGLSFSPDGLNLASAGADRTIILWDSGAWKPIQTLRGHSDEVLRLSYSPDGKWLASGGKDKTVKIWKTGPAAQKTPFVSYPPDMYPDVWRVAYLCRHGDRFMMARSNGTFRVFSKSSLQALGEYRLPVTNLVISQIAPDGRHLACWCADGRIRVFETESLKQKAVFETKAEYQRALAFSPDGRVLAGCADNRMWAWNLESQKEIMRDDKSPGGVLTVAFSPDGRWFASTQYGSSTAVVWDLEMKQRVAVLQSGAVAVRDAAIDPSRRYVVTVGDEDDAKLWDPWKQTQIASVRGLSTYLLSVAFSPDGERFATGGGTFVTIWDTNTKREVAVLKSAYGPILWLEFLSDGNTLLVATETGVFSWRAPSFEEIARAEKEKQR